MYVRARARMFVCMLYMYSKEQCLDLTKARNSQSPCIDENRIESWKPSTFISHDIYLHLSPFLSHLTLSLSTYPLFPLCSLHTFVSFDELKDGKRKKKRKERWQVAWSLNVKKKKRKNKETNIETFLIANDSNCLEIWIPLWLFTVISSLYPPSYFQFVVHFFKSPHFRIASLKEKMCRYPARSFLHRITIKTLKEIVQERKYILLFLYLFLLFCFVRYLMQQQNSYEDKSEE